jgi:hypothetical protein
MDVDARRNLLTQKLSERGVQYRHDSRLIKRYVRHGKGDVDEIVDVLKGMQFLFKKTRYAKYRRMIRLHETNKTVYDPEKCGLNEECEHVAEFENGVKIRFSELDHFKISKLAKEYALREYEKDDIPSSLLNDVDETSVRKVH